MFADIEEVQMYIDDLLLITNGLKINMQTSFFSLKELEYLGYWVTNQGIKPLQKKLEAVLRIAAPTTRKQLCSFIGMINYYCNMWQDHSKVLAPLTVLMSKTTPWAWMSVKQKAYDQAKKIVNQETLLAYLDFNLPFEIHMDASDTQLG
eukprot:7054297-Ditylum_brightwellii.AAC.1